MESENPVHLVGGKERMLPLTSIHFTTFSQVKKRKMSKLVTCLINKSPRNCDESILPAESI